MAYKPTKEQRAAISHRHYLKHKEEILEKAKGYNHTRHIRNKEELNQQSKEYYYSHQEELSVKNKIHQTKFKEKYKSQKLFKMYGITLAEYNQMLESQNHCCKICKQHKDSFKKALSVDHCHTTGKVRGLLCFLCNTAIGKFPSEELLKEAIKYLNEGS